MVFVDHLLRHRNPGVHQVASVKQVDSFILQGTSNDSDVPGPQIPVADPPQGGAPAAVFAGFAGVLPSAVALQTYGFQVLVGDQVECPEANASL